MGPIQVERLAPKTLVREPTRFSPLRATRSTSTITFAVFRKSDSSRPGGLGAYRKFTTTPQRPVPAENYSWRYAPTG